MKILLELFCSFFKTGLFTFGGGYAMLPILKDEVVTKRHWTTEEELLKYFSIGQCTPGIIAINVATFCGYKLQRTAGALMATFALVLPSFFIITLIASLLSHFMENETALHIIRGVRIGVLVVLVKVIFDLAKKITVPFAVETDRVKAIKYASEIAKDNSIIALCGKGVETYQDIKAKMIKYSDYDEVEKLKH